MWSEARRSFLHTGLPWLVIACAACEAAGPGGPAVERVDASWVVGAALAALGPDGRFDFDAPLPPATGEVDRDQAVRLAVAAARFIGRAVGGEREALEAEHGAPIDFGMLEWCGRRVIPVYSVFGSLPPDTPREVATPLGPAYFVDLCSRTGIPQVLIEMFAGTRATIGPNGELVLPQPYGTEFLPFGLPLAPMVDLSPEYGARLVHEAVRVPISELPVLDGCLVVTKLCLGSNGWHWRYHLERPVSVRLRATGLRVDVQDLYTQAGYGAYGPDDVFVPGATQPAPAWMYFSRLAPDGTTQPDSVLLSPARPIALEPIGP